MSSRRYRILVFVLCLGCTACAERPRIGVEVTNSPTIRECIPGSATRPCN